MPFPGSKWTKTSAVNAQMRDRRVVDKGDPEITRAVEEKRLSYHLAAILNHGINAASLTMAPLRNFSDDAFMGLGSKFLHSLALFGASNAAEFTRDGVTIVRGDITSSSAYGVAVLAFLQHLLPLAPETMRAAQRRFERC